MWVFRITLSIRVLLRFSPALILVSKLSFSVFSPLFNRNVGVSMYGTVRQFDVSLETP